ncbi:hypothetical protein J7I98_29030 [Streptomyces sp. ISL-98]|uniref:hypothetical protein n=1 Tax=Streptomyces sp. ISL-98 TaxID=2819192 RepID=UPI001BE9E1D1|nr:hypothetical protein [Streptomyces sp. ISL-98]MBT2509839.1 hypothetical protein [Streptomyces sp. ISL-98]
MIKPEDIPRFTGRQEELEKAVGALSADGSGFTSTGTDIHSRFQSLSSYYEAPEAEKLFATTAAVQTAGENLGADVESVARALGEYANEIRPLVARLDDLRKQAIAFVAEAKGDEGLLNSWQRDQKKVDKNEDLVNDVTATTVAFWEAERTAANKIMALFSCVKYQANDGSNKPDMYGYSADALKDAELPWGTVEERTFLPGNIDRHIKSFVWDGLIVDNIWGTIQGLGALVGIGADASDTWDALGRVFLGAGDYVQDPRNERPGGLGDLPIVQESRKDAKEFAKGLVAWDMWSENPARASATVVFNILTLGVGPLKAGTAAKAGLGAKTAGTAAKIGGLLDPVSATIKAAGAAAPKIAEITAGLRKAVPDLPEAADGSVRLPEGYILRADGELVRPDGSVARKGAGEMSAADRAALDDASRIPERVPAAVSETRVPAAMANAGENLEPRANHGPPDNHHINQGGSGNGGLPSSGSGDAAHGAVSGGDHLDSVREAPTGAGGHDGGHPESHRAGASESPGGPARALTPEEQAAHAQHLEEIEQRHADDFDQLKQDPDHKGKVKPSEMDEARLALDLREQGKVPDDIQRPPEANHGDLYSPSTGEFYDIKGVHSDWPPLNNVRDKSLPFKGAYNPADNQGWIRKLRDQIVAKERIVILDTRNANQAAIDDLREIAKRNGWSDRIVWYP